MRNTQKVSSESNIEWVHSDSMANKNHIPVKCLQDSNSCEYRQHRDLPGTLSHLMYLQEIHSAIYRLSDLPPILPFFVLTMKISAQWCRVDTSYFTHNWETRGGGSILFLSVQVQRTCPLPPPPKCDFRKEIVPEQTSQHTNTRMWKDIIGCSIKYTESTFRVELLLGVDHKANIPYKCQIQLTQ